MMHMAQYPIFLALISFIIVGVCHQQKLGDQKTKDVCFMRAEAGWAVCTRKEDKQSCIHNPSRGCGWVIESYRPVFTDRSSKGATYSASLISGQAQYSLIKTREVEKHYNQLISAAAKLGKVTLKAKLEADKKQKLNQFGKFYNNGAQTLSAQATATGKPPACFGGLGWIEMHYKVVEEYVGCTVSELTQEIESDPVYKSDFAKVQQEVKNPSPRSYTAIAAANPFAGFNPFCSNPPC